MKLDVASVNACPYCMQTPGVGPHPRSVPATPFDAVIAEAAGIVVTPTLGMMLPGYLLAITATHVTGFAYLSRADLVRADEFMRDLLVRLAPLFGKYIIFEHGSDASGDESSGACITHAHLHLIPAAVELEPALHAALRFAAIRSLADLVAYRGQRYALLGSGGNFFVATAPELPGQWVRRQLAAVRLVPGHWDWAIDDGARNLEISWDRLQTAGFAFATKDDD